LYIAHFVVSLASAPVFRGVGLLRELNHPIRSRFRSEIVDHFEDLPFRHPEYLFVDNASEIMDCFETEATFS
jgi:hypothetical protein